MGTGLHGIIICWSRKSRGAGLQWDSLGQEASQYFTEVCTGPRHHSSRRKEKHTHVGHSSRIQGLISAPGVAFTEDTKSRDARSTRGKRGVKISAPWSPNDLVQPSHSSTFTAKEPHLLPLQAPPQKHTWRRLKGFWKNQVLPETPGNPADGAEELLFYVLKLNLTLEWEDSWPAPWWGIWLKIRPWPKRGAALALSLWEVMDIAHNRDVFAVGRGRPHRTLGWELATPGRPLRWWVGMGRPWVTGYELTWGLRSTSGQQINHLRPQDQSIMSMWWSRSENSKHWSSGVLPWLAVLWAYCHSLMLAQ